ncbi:adrenocortical dysplasia protein homolog isoform X1 [Lepisosteus oculatus]|uniref:adrenocortical dysplasia protein homolog isoform X1 n=1 Tax=Lepisosteus oculatus TaxID=7918 RepID=UPI0035F52584
MSLKNPVTIQPWIDLLLQKYGQEEEPTSVKAHVIGFGNVSGLQNEQVENPAAVVFLSDHQVFIPGIITREAWEELEEEEDYCAFFDLKDYIVILVNYSVMFQMEKEESKCQFFILIKRLRALRSEPVIHDVPNCKTLPRVKQQIYKLWMSCVEDEDSMKNNNTGYSLTQLLHYLDQEKVKTLRTMARKCLDGTCSSPVPSTSRAALLPLTPCPPADWKSIRTQDKGERPFTIPVSHLIIPARQRELLARVPERPAGAPSFPSTSGPASERWPAQEVTDPAECELDLECTTDPEQDTRTTPDPWSRFQPMEISDVSSAGESVTPDDLPTRTSTQCPAVSQIVPGEAGPSSPEPERQPGAELSGQRSSLTHKEVRKEADVLGFSLHDLSRESQHCSFPAYQEPKSLNAVATSISPISRSSLTAHTGTGSQEGSQAERARSPPAHSRATDPTYVAPTLREPAPAPLRMEEGDEMVLMRKACTGKRKYKTPGKEISIDEDRDGGLTCHSLESASPKRSNPVRKVTQPKKPLVMETRPELPTAAASQGSSLCWDREAVTRRSEDKQGAGHHSNPVNTHRDGSPFMYSYTPSVSIMKAVRSLRVSENLLKWSVQYLLSPGPAVTVDTRRELSSD